MTYAIRRFLLVYCVVMLLAGSVSAVLADDAGTVTTEPAGASVTLDDKMDEIDDALAEVKAQLEELAKQRAELEALKTDLQAAGATGGSKKTTDDNWDYFGFMQIQTSWDHSTGGVAQYQVRRFYNVFDYNIDDNAKARLLLNTSGTVGMLDAWIENQTGDVRVRAGQFVPPFSLDMQRSSSVRRAHEYARAYTQLFPGIYDLGVTMSTAPSSTHAGRFEVALMSGNGANNADNNTSKDIVARYAQPFANGKGLLSLSAVSGEFTTSPTDGTNPVTTGKNLWGFGASYKSGQWELQGEMLSGRARGNDVLGGYFETAYTTGRHTLFGRYDYYDPNTALDGNAYIAPILGYEYAWSAKNKLSLEAALINNNATAGSDYRYQVRWQTKW